MKTITVHRFKASGKWYDTFTLEISTENSEPHYDHLGRLLREQRSLLAIHPINRTLDSWFVVTTINELPTIVWLKP